jgi:hypothetical protein
MTAVAPAINASFFVPRIRGIRLFALAVVVLLLANAPVWSQGFSGAMGSKKTVILHRKLPAAVKLTGISTFEVTGNAKNKDQADVAQTLSDVLTTEIQKDDRRLQEDKKAPELVITTTITHYETPPPQTSTRNESVLEKGKMVTIPKQYYRIFGELEVAYQAKDQNSGRMLDSQNLSSKYNREFESGSNQATDKSVTAKMTDPFKRLAGKKVEDTGAPPTQLELRQRLIHDVVMQIAARLVSTDEPVQVLLAHGKQLDSANKLAESGLWSRYLETLETATPFNDPREDAYRIYNIGVANEALGYQSEDRKSASKFLQEAAINYGKAVDARPDEKYFLEPQTRVETAVVYYKKLNEPQAVAEEKPAAPPMSSSDSSTTKSSSASTTPKSGTTKSPSSSGTASGTDASSDLNSRTAKAAKSVASALTNQKVVDMLKGGVDEDNIIATIKEAPNVQFDLSPDGQIQLAQNGVKGKVLAAMRERSHRPSTSKAPP